MKKIYIASPYTKGDVAVNVKRQLDCFDELLTLGFAPFAPLYSHFQHMAHPRPYSDWIKLDLEWVDVCDGLLRLDGESSGADGEVKYATELGIPVFYSIEELNSYKWDTEIINRVIQLEEEQKELISLLKKNLEVTKHYIKNHDYVLISDTENLLAKYK